MVKKKWIIGYQPISGVWSLAPEKREKRRSFVRRGRGRERATVNIEFQALTTPSASSAAPRLMRGKPKRSKMDANDHLNLH